jgi:hypothetical protein
MTDNTDKYWQEFKNTSTEDTFERMSSWLTYTRLKIQPKTKNMIGGKIFQIISMNKVKVAAVLGLVLLVSLGNYPVTKNKTVGYVVKFTAPVDKVIEVNEQLEKLDWVDKSSITLQEKDSAGYKSYEYKILLKDSVEKDIALKKSDIENIKAFSTVQVMPIAAAMEVPMYSVALGNIFNIDESEKIVNEKEFEKEIQNQFINAGLNNFVFTVDPVKHKGKFKIEIPENTVIPRDSLRKLNKMIRIEIENANREIAKEDAKLKIQMDKLQEQQEILNRKLERVSELDNFRNDRRKNIKINPDNNEITVEENGNKVIVNPDGVILYNGKEILNIPSDINFDFNFEGMDKKEVEEMKKKLKEDIKKKIKEEVINSLELRKNKQEIPDMEIPEVKIPDVEIPGVEVPDVEPPASVKEN